MPFWVPLAAAAIGGGLSYLGSREQAKAQREAMQDPWNQSFMWPGAESHANSLLDRARQLHAQGAYAPGPHLFDIEGRRKAVRYARSEMPELVSEAQESWRQGLNPELNPYLEQMIDASQRGLTEDYERVVLPRIGSAAQAVGGFGGSRQGVAEGIASEGLTEALSDVDTRMRTAAHEQALNQQRAAWGASPMMLGLGMMPYQQLMQLGGMYQQDQMAPARNLAGYANMITPYTQPQHQAGGPYMGPVGPNPYTSVLQGIGGGLGLYNMWNQYMNQDEGAWGGGSPLGGSGAGTTGGLWDLYQS